MGIATATAGAGILYGVRVHHGGNEGDPGGDHASQERTPTDLASL